MLEHFLIQHCAPTLAGIKTGNLFGMNYTSLDELWNSISSWNEQLNHRGVFLTPLRAEEGRALIYVYRRTKLMRDWFSPCVRRFLSRLGYDTRSIPAAVGRLSKRIQENGRFPHEIGLFLGYPFEDVVGFIENQGRNCKCSGCWKVYCNEFEAQRKFALFKKCTRIYCRCYFTQGMPIQRLTVAA